MCDLNLLLPVFTLSLHCSGAISLTVKALFVQLTICIVSQPQGTDPSQHLLGHKAGATLQHKKAVVHVLNARLKLHCKRQRL